MELFVPEDKLQKDYFEKNKMIDFAKCFYTREESTKSRGSVYIKLGEFRRLKDNTELFKHILNTTLKTLQISIDNGFNNMDVYIDLENIKMADMDLKFGIDVTKFMQKNIPDRLYHFYIINPPKYFSKLYTFFAAMVDEVTLAKVKIIKPEDNKSSNSSI